MLLLATGRVSLTGSVGAAISCVLLLGKSFLIHKKMLPAIVARPSFCNYHEAPQSWLVPQVFAGVIRPLA